MRCALAFLGVLLQPCVAFRVEIESHNHNTLASQTNSTLFTADVIAALEEVADIEEDETQQWCTALSARRTRSFRFELTYEDGQRAAMELERHPRDPVIRIYRGGTWSVRLLRERDRYTGEMEESLDWGVVVPGETGEPVLDAQGNMVEDRSEPVVIDVRKDLAFIRRIQREGEQQTGIQFGFMNGDTQEFAGGLYYPENAMQRSLVRAFRQRQRQHEREVREANRGLTSTEAPTEVETLNRVAGDRELNTGASVVDTSRDIVTGIYEGAKFSAIQAFAFSFLPIIGTNPFALGAAWTATVGGLYTGVVYGAAFVIPTTLIGAIHSWRHERRELSMTASEKLFEKFSCHRMIGVCQDGELIGQDSVRIFARRPDGDVLIPFGGDSDPFTQLPLDRIVTWGTAINNTGNIECTDSRVQV